jgi:hypothetical protein
MKLALRSDSCELNDGGSGISFNVGSCPIDSKTSDDGDFNSSGVSSRSMSSFGTGDNDGERNGLCSNGEISGTDGITDGFNMSTSPDEGDVQRR